MKLGLAMLFVSSVAAAEPRSFTHTFEYATLPSGDGEIELWHREIIHDAGVARGETLDEQLQVGFGATEHVEVDVIGAVTDDGVAMHFAALRGEARGRIADRGELPVDLGIHAGVAKEFDERVYDAYARLVLARDFDRISIAVTGQVLFRFGADSFVAKRQYDGAAGMTYELAPRLHAGLETWGTIDTDSNHLRSYELGPAVAVRASQNLWIAVSAGFGLTNSSNDFDGRLILGFAR